MDDNPDLASPRPSEILLWRLGRMWAWFLTESRDGRPTIPCDEWDILDVDRFARSGHLATNAVDLEIDDDGFGHRWHTSDGAVLLFLPERRFPFSLMTAEDWARRHEGLLEAAVRNAK